MANNQEKLETYQLIRNIRHRYSLDKMENGSLGQVLPMVDRAKQRIKASTERARLIEFSGGQP